MKRYSIVVVLLVLLVGALSAEDILYEGKLGQRGSSPLKGDWQIVREDDGTRILRLENNFRARRGPDLKIFFSTLPLKNINDRNAGRTQYAVKIAKLKKFSGAQEYRLPDSIDLSEYKSWIIHCEAYSHFWDGADITP